MVDTKDIVRVMAGRRGFRKKIRTLGELRKAVSEGLPKSALRNAASSVAMGESANQIIYRVVPRGTYSKRKKLSQAESERTERLARIVATAQFVFDGDEIARRFLNVSHPLLGGETPLELSYSELGAREVEELLWRIFYGVPS
jgi:putative toxin-antitoxin system antitoxin component (TIGR02293 family)